MEVKLLKPDINDSNKRVTDQSVKVDFYSRITVWEFKNYVTRLVGLSPKYAMVRMPNGEPLRENMHGLLIEEVEAGFQGKKEMLRSGSVILIEKIPYPEKLIEGEIVCTDKLDMLRNSVRTKVHISPEFQAIRDEIWERF